MKILTQIGIIFSICLIGEAITAFLPISFPPSVMSMVLLFAVFLLKWLKPDSIRETAEFLLNNMAVFFVPAAVGIIKYFDTIRPVIVQVAVICIVSAVIVFGTTAYTIRFAVWLENKIRNRGAGNE